MSEGQTFFLAVLYSVTGIAANFFGVKMPDWAFQVFVLALAVTIASALFRIIVRNRASRRALDASDEKRRNDARAARRARNKKRKSNAHHA
ncbi:MAG: hypothetical protein AWU57_354 [Marinobacter sp. T13-3]|nr:MAG: hypothetical protein AWU57_354 [Marinobacter sp. T13-3]